MSPAFSSCTPSNIGQQDELFRAQCPGDFAGGDVRVDIIGLTFSPYSNRRNNRNKPAVSERGQHSGVDGIDFAYQPDIDLLQFVVFAFRNQAHLPGHHQFAVLAGEANGAAAVTGNQRRNLFVEPLQHHLGSFHGGLVSHAHAAYKT